MLHQFGVKDFSVTIVCGVKLVRLPERRSRLFGKFVFYKHAKGAWSVTLSQLTVQSQPVSDLKIIIHVTHLLPQSSAVVSASTVMIGVDI